MKSLHLNMYKRIKYIAAVLIICAGFTVDAQITTQSPYSKFGLGNLDGLVLPQFRAMGGISTAVNKPNGYSNINMMNPASYGGINLTTVDIGLRGGFTELKKGSNAETSFNSTLSHVALGIPITTRSAMSFGVLPYSVMGYEFINTGKLGTADVNYLYSGEGGLNKAYFGYGYQFGSHLRIGANLDYYFGSLKQSQAVELQNQNGATNSKDESKNSVNGVGFSYGIQYDIPLGNKMSMTLGYSGSSSSTINSRKTSVTTQYKRNPETGDVLAVRVGDTLNFVDNSKTNLKLPLIHNFGLTLQKDNKWMIGADYRTGKWSELTIDQVNQGLEDSYGFSAGAQITPDITSIGSYFKRVDYRLGFKYDKSYIRMSGQDIKEKAITFGFGFPLAPNPRNITFYKLNLGAELGRRGTLANSLVQESYVNIHLGFTLNDKWFRRFKFE